MLPGIASRRLIVDCVVDVLAFARGRKRRGRRRGLPSGRVVLPEVTFWCGYVIVANGASSQLGEGGVS